MTKNIVILVGIPGSGKSTEYKNRYSDSMKTLYINADSIRKELYGDENIQGDGKVVFSKVFSKFKRGLIDPSVERIVVDNTNVSFKSRKQFYEMIEDYSDGDYRIDLIFFDNFELAKKRNLSRDRVVPEEVMDRMISNFQGPNSWEEQNAHITFISK